MADEQTGLPDAPAKSSRAIIHVLLAEDTVINQKIAARQLEQLGCQVGTASTGLEAVAAFRHIEFDLVLMDCQMPQMDGYSATRLIRQLETGGRHTPIIAMTASAAESDRSRCLAAGMDDYISKPVREADLAALLEKWVKPFVQP